MVHISLNVAHDQLCGYGLRAAHRRKKGRIVKADASALGKSAVGVGDISALYRCRQLLIIRDVVGDIFKYGGDLFSITVTACAKLRSLFNAVIRLAEADVLGGQKIWAEIGNLCRKAFVKGNGIGLARYIFQHLYVIFTAARLQWIYCAA